MASLINLLGYNIYAGERGSLAEETGVLNTLNPHCYVIARKDREYYEALKSSGCLIPDGVGIVYAARFLGGKKIERIAGSDLHEIIVESLDRRGGSCFYLGASEDTLDKIIEKLAKERPSVKAGSFSPQYREKFSEEENSSMINAVNRFSPDVLFVGMTAPKQEKWIHENKHRINARVICAIGAVFDFYAGTKKRPSRFWISIGLEWLPRLLREPGRLWRRTLISTPLFIWYVLWEKIRLVFSRRDLGT